MTEENLETLSKSIGTPQEFAKLLLVRGADSETCEWQKSQLRIRPLLRVNHPHNYKVNTPNTCVHSEWGCLQDALAFLEKT